MIFSILLLSIISNAHNWIQSNRGPQSRCPEACPTIPSPAKPAVRTPHLKVGSGQHFALQWTTGHVNTVFYFVVTHATNEGELGRHSSDLLDDYIDDALDSGDSSIYKWSNQRYDRTHVSCSYYHQNHDRSDCSGNVINYGEIVGTGIAYDKILEEGDPEYFETPEAWTSEAWLNNNEDLSDLAQFRIPSSELSRDVRVEYHNPKYPWIEAVHKFYVNEIGNPREWDLAQFYISANQGSGEYLIHMIWGGYRDVIDVDIYPHETNDIYGRLGPVNWVKVEHCQYPNYIPGAPNQSSANPPWFIVGDLKFAVKPCLDACENFADSRCTAVNVVPLKTPVNEHLRPDYNFPWETPYGTAEESAIFGTCDTPEKLRNCRPEEWDPPYPEWAEFVCYGIVPVAPDDPSFNPETENFWYTRDDPEDPIFYSTCYRMEAELVFQDNGDCPACEAGSVVGGVLASAEWEFGEQCYTCETASKTPDQFTVVKWQTNTGSCKKCF